MNITFLRNCFANNSSSSHSLIFSPNVEDDLCCSGFDFGWDDFALASKNAKLKYMLAALWDTWGQYNRFNNTIIDTSETNKFSRIEFKKFIVNNFSDTFPRKMINACTSQEYYGIDHQSQITFPLHRDYGYRANGKFFNLNFAKDFINFIVNNPFVILGGNDNDGGNPKKSSDIGEFNDIKTLWDFLQDRGDYSCVTEKDELTGEYIISRIEGPICKVTFDKNRKKQEKAQFPYLVDIKVTDKCSNGCQFCYMNSTPDGKGASFDYLKRLAYSLAQANVFEVAIGGGSVEEYFDEKDKGKSYHTQFSDIVRVFHDKRFKIGITTRNYNLHKHSDFNNFKENISSIAISCPNREDLDSAKELYDSLGGGKHVSVQYILEAHDLQYFKTYLKELKALHFYSLTVLGAKECGRGLGFKWHKHGDGWIKEIKNSGIHAGIDSILVKKYHDAIIKAGVQHYYLQGTEGQSTCFIDAVQQRMYPSSFDKTHNGIDLALSDRWSEEDKNVKIVLDAFSKF